MLLLFGLKTVLNNLPGRPATCQYCGRHKGQLRGRLQPYAIYVPGKRGANGYGLTLGPVNEVTSEGLPVLFTRDLPPHSIAGGIPAKVLKPVRYEP